MTMAMADFDFVVRFLFVAGILQLLLLLPHVAHRGP
jgi:hypothetical protein